MICLGSHSSANGVLRMLDGIFDVNLDIDKKQIMLENEFSINISEPAKRGLKTMCNLGDGLVERGRKE